MCRKQLKVILIVLFTVFVLAPWISADEIRHKVKSGETLSGIARKYKVSIKTIEQVNNIKSVNYIKAGDNLRIPTKGNAQDAGGPADGKWHVVKSGDTLTSIAQTYNIKSWKDIQKTNGISNPNRLSIGQELFIPDGESVTFIEPLNNNLVVTSHYGYRPHPVTGRYRLHQGIDFRAAIGTRVYASKTGRVTFAARKGGFGKTVVIQHDDDFTTWYGHLSRIIVSTGDIVRQGQVIGLSGNTGISTGPHLHFEIRYKGRSENPVRHLNLP